MRLFTLAFLTLFLANTSIAQLVIAVDQASPGNEVAFSGTTSLVLTTDPGSCYCCTFVPNPTQSVPAFIAAFEIDSGSGFENLAVENRTFTAPRTFRGQRACFSTPDNGNTSTIRFTVAGANPALVRCDETKLFGGFNISATPFNFLEIVNTLSSNETDDGTVTPKVTVSDTVSDQTILDNFSVDPVNAGKRKDIDLGSSVRQVVGDATVAPVVFGPVSLCHDGPPGSLRVTLSQYDANLNLVNQQEFKSRGQMTGSR